MLEYNGARIQLLDLPVRPRLMFCMLGKSYLIFSNQGIVEGASQGRGRGRQVVGVAKSADLIIVMIDATKSLEQKRLLEIELDAVGIRLNSSKPDGMALISQLLLRF